MQRDTPVRDDGEKSHDGHESQTADLNEQKNDDLPKDAPMGVRIHDDQTRDAGGARRRKERGDRICPFTLGRWDRQAQDQRTDQYHAKEA